MAALGIVVLFVTALAPFARLIGTLCVLIRAHEAIPQRHLRRVFALAEKLRPWSMIDVFVFGVFVAYVKLGEVVTIGLAVGGLRLVGLDLCSGLDGSALDREEVWERLDHGVAPDNSRHRLTSLVGCETCGLVSPPRLDDPRCPSCQSVLHARKPDSIARSWALVIAAAVLYIPANYYPVLSVVPLGAGAPSTILGGVEEPLAARQYPLAALVFFASILVPMLKLVGLSIMLIATQTGRAGWAARSHPTLSYRALYRPLVDRDHRAEDDQSA